MLGLGDTSTLASGEPNHFQDLRPSAIPPETNDREQEGDLVVPHASGEGLRAA